MYFIEAAKATAATLLCRNSSRDGSAPKHDHSRASAQLLSLRRRLPTWESSGASRHLTSEDWQIVEELIKEDVSPEQSSGLLTRDGILEVSHETIYQHIWR